MLQAAQFRHIVPCETEMAMPHSILTYGDVWMGRIFFYQERRVELLAALSKSWHSDLI